MISTSFILSTGLKKWMPTKRSGALLAFARPLIGRVDVLLANKPPGASIVSASCVTRAFSSRFSNTASMIRSHPCSACTESAGVMRASSCSCSSGLMLPWRTRASVSLRAWSRPAWAFSIETSRSTVATPRLACA